LLWLGLRARKARAMRVSVYYERCGVWVPACAGTTEEGGDDKREAWTTKKRWGDDSVGFSTGDIFSPTG
jgi:hypothetical protein